jgi:hypothetical protein
MVYCQRCGIENDEESKFCKGCRTILVNNTVNQDELEDKKKHILRQIKILSGILIFCGLVSLIMSMLVFEGLDTLLGTIVLVSGLLFVVLPIVLIINKSPVLVLITGLLALLVGVGSILPMLSGIGLIYYHFKYKDVLKQLEI